MDAQLVTRIGFTPAGTESSRDEITLTAMRSEFAQWWAEGGKLVRDDHTINGETVAVVMAVDPDTGRAVTAWATSH